MEFVSPEQKQKIIDSLVEQDSKYEVIKGADGNTPKYFGYGTAGFRTLGTHLERVCYRVGILVALRARLTTLSGVMITASHNGKEDNGVKIIEADGSMLGQSWEPLAEELANTQDLRALLEKIDNTDMKHQLGFQETVFHADSFAQACFAKDTRETSEMLIQAAMKGCELMGVKITNFGLCSTPQLHWLISQRLTDTAAKPQYAANFTKVFLSFMSLCESADGFQARKNYDPRLMLDCANGVGSVPISEMMALQGFKERLPLILINCEEAPDNLNHQCGAEHIHKDQSAPTGWTPEQHAGKKCVSFDGDADRQMYYYGDDQGNFKIIDGDKQFALIMMYIQGLLKELGIEEQLSHILVQTAYCNSRVTQFLNTNNIHNQLVKTGVKYAHPVVITYDIGANNEPNGHGTVAYKIEQVNKVLGDNNSLAAQKLKGILAISNIVVGDSIANVLLIEAILFDLDMTVQQFSEIYVENPSRLYKIKVADRTQFKTIADESRLTEPAEVQEEIDAAVAQVKEGKAFVRPSGTEDILRLYSEAATLEEMNQLAQTILDAFQTKFTKY